MPLSSTDNAKCHLLFAARRRCWRTPFSKNQGFVAQIVRAAMVCESVTQFSDLWSHTEDGQATISKPATTACLRQGDSCSFDHLVGKREQPVWNLEAERLGGLEIDGQFKLRRLLNGKIGRLGSLQNAIDIRS
jgi:hypothetical protein